jgi:hypothetical protein
MRERHAADVGLIKVANQTPPVFDGLTALYTHQRCDLTVFLSLPSD